MSESEFQVVADMVARECPDAKLALEGRDPLPQYVRDTRDDGVVEMDVRIADVRANEPPRFLARRIVDAIKGVDAKAEEIPVRRTPVEEGSGNVFADLGLDDPERRLAEADQARRTRLAAEAFKAKFDGLPNDPKTMEELKERMYFETPIDWPAEKVAAFNAWNPPDAPKTLVAGDPGVVMVAVPASRVREVEAYLAGPADAMCPPVSKAEFASLLALGLNGPNFLKLSEADYELLKKRIHEMPPPDPTPAVRELADRMTRMQQMFEQALLAPKQAGEGLGKRLEAIESAIGKLLGKMEAVEQFAAKKTGGRK